MFDIPMLVAEAMRDIERRDEVQWRRRFDDGDAYFNAPSHEWSEGTREVFRQLPELGW